MVNYGDLQFAERIMVARKAMMSGELEYIYSILPSYETCILNRNYPSILHLLANRQNKLPSYYFEAIMLFSS